MYTHSITLELYRYMEMIENFIHTVREYTFFTHQRHSALKHTHVRAKRRHEPLAHKEERKHRRMEEENKVREEKEAFDAIEKIREKEHHGI